MINNMMPSIFDAINSLAPNSVWSMSEGDYSTLEWGSENIPKPSQSDIETELKRLRREFALSEYQRRRAAEYPDFRDYLDGIVKGDEVQMQNYVDACLAVKAKYPKPGE